MATIKINNLNATGSELFSDSETYLTDLTEEEMNMTHGGRMGITRHISSNFCRITARFW
jgi:hypothetical protein